MTEKTISLGTIEMANSKPFVLFGGMNVLESRDLAMQICEHYVTVTQKLGIPYVFKASFDKANRTSVDSFRGPGIHEGCRILGEIERMERRMSRGGEGPRPPAGSSRPGGIQGHARTPES